MENNSGDINVVVVKLNAIEEQLHQLVTMGLDMEKRIDTLEADRHAMKILVAIVIFLSPFVVAIGTFSLDAYIKQSVVDKLEQIERSKEWQQE